MLMILNQSSLSWSVPSAHVDHQLVVKDELSPLVAQVVEIQQVLVAVYAKHSRHVLAQADRALLAVDHLIAVTSFLDQYITFKGKPLSTVCSTSSLCLPL